MRPHRQQPTRLPHPWDSPGKHTLLQCMKVKSESEVAQSCPTLRNPMDYSPPGSSVHGIFQVRVLEWISIPLLGSSKWEAKILGEGRSKWIWRPTETGPAVVYTLSHPVSSHSLMKTECSFFLERRDVSTVEKRFYLFFRSHHVACGILVP